MNHPRLASGGVLLHVGCGQKTRQHTPFAAYPNWREIRLDLDASVQPDVVATMLHMPAISDGGVDAVFSSHNLEHLEAHQVVQALSEFRRVLQADGFCLITCPDLQSLGEALSADRLSEPLYASRSGAITPLDILYGHGASLAAGHRHMAHRCGFSAGSLRRQLLEAGFAHVVSARRPSRFDLWALAAREQLDPAALEPLARHLFSRG